ncbi:selenocysteine-specific translation elongation factor [Streptomyces melanogenes]|uniref:Selenocysteine-specific elongation factor n=1 Tax=Streptomyces melanogenes TaxID=67326 RepID=A0ABZ1XR93_9ACTN|nr:selenocysteine-specific translation elongation factor [Streptomyces melanogenes]
MHVIATAGHVDHGKSTLVRALTGRNPDRLAEEQRRNMTIDLGFAWTTLDVGQEIAFVDVPGHANFVPTMLAGIGPVPAVLFVVAADEGWMPQSAEHLAALDALRVRHGLLVVTRSDLAAPEPARAQALAKMRTTSLRDVDCVAVSSRTGAGLERLRHCLAKLVQDLAPPDASGPVRLWVDRVFTVRGAGLVTTGTLPQGTIEVGDELVVAPRGIHVKVRGIQSLETETSTARGVARVALNLRGLGRDDIRRGDALLTPRGFLDTTVCDVRLHHTGDARLPKTLMLHIGAATRAVHVRPLGSQAARLSFAPALPLHIGDRALLRDPGRHQIVTGVTVLDVQPPELRRRGAATLRARQLAALSGTQTEAQELAHRRLVRRPLLEAMGVRVTSTPVAADWLADPGYWQDMARRLTALVSDHAAAQPYSDGLPLESARQALGLPELALVTSLVEPPLVLHRGRIVHQGEKLPEALATAVQRVREVLLRAPFRAPEAQDLAELHLGVREIRRAVRAGLLLCLEEKVVLLPDAPERALAQLARLEQPFTVAAATRALDTTRRVSLPLLRHLDRQGLTFRLNDNRREVVQRRG